MVFVAFVDQLVRTGDELEIVHVVELKLSRQQMGETVRDAKVELTSLDTLSPNNHPAPLGLTAQVSTSSGSLHTRSQKAPSCGISCALATTRI